VDNDKISATGFLGNTLSDFKFAFVVVSDAFIVTHWLHGLGTSLQAFLEDILDTIALVQADTIVDNDKISATGFLGNTLSDFKFAFVVVSDAFIVTHWCHDLRANLQALFEHLLDAISLLVLANSIVHNGDDSATRFLSNTLPAFKLAHVVVSDTLIVTNWHQNLWAIL